MGREENQDLATELAHVARDLLAQSSVRGTLDRIVYHACHMVPGCEHAGILLVRPRRRVETAAATAAMVRDSIQAQGELSEGPCFDAAWQGSTYRVDDMASEDRWPRFAPQASRIGIGSVIGFQLFTDEQNLGALDLYSRRPHAFTDESEQAGWIFASHASVALSSARSDAHLQSAIETRQEIGEAIGILMERYKITSLSAFDLLKNASQQTNIKLREVANTVVTTGEIPGS